MKDLPPFPKGQISWDEIGCVRNLYYEFILGSYPNLKETYPQPHPSFSHGGFTSQSLYIEGISKVKGGTIEVSNL